MQSDEGFDEVSSTCEICAEQCLFYFKLHGGIQVHYFYYVVRWQEIRSPEISFHAGGNATGAQYVVAMN